MTKFEFRQQINDYLAGGGEMVFRFGDLTLPVRYHEMLGTLAVEMPGRNTFVLVNYNWDLVDNLGNLLDHLLDRHPELSY